LVEPIEGAGRRERKGKEKGEEEESEQGGERKESL